MKVTNPAPGRPERIQRGLASTLRATGRGITLRDNGVDVEPVWDIIAGQGLRVTDLDDGLARLDAIGGTGPDGGPTGGGSIVEMLNNSGQDLLPGSVVVVDETADKAVTTTTTEGDTRIVGVVQEPIGIGDVGLVLFNGYAPVINAPGAVRGEYAKTATSTTEAASTTDREAGSFAVYLTGEDFSEFVSSERTTTAQIPTTELTIDMPPVIPADRLLFLALWLEDGTSSIDVDEWTLIGSETGFYYFYKISEGDDTATATWTTASTAVATVLLLHPSISLAVPIADHDYDATTSAAAVSGLDTAVPKYAIAGVQATATPGSGYVRLGGGTAGFVSGGSTALVQWTHGHKSTWATFDDAPTVGNLLVAIPWQRNDQPVTLYDPRDPGSCPEVTDWGQHVDTYGATTGSNGMAMYAKVANETYAGPFETNAACNSNASDVTLLEFSGVGSVVAAAELDDQIGSDIDLGTFADYGSDDVIVMAVVFKKDGGGDPGVSFAADGFTELLDSGLFGFSDPHMWLGYKIGGTGVAKVTHTGGTDYNWGAGAIHLAAADQGVAGTLAGKYIGTSATATSPFTGSGAQDDALIAFNLLAAAKPSALLYGPDLGDGGGSEPTADAHIADIADAHDASAISVADAGGYLVGTDVEAALAELAANARGWTDHGSAGATETISFITGHHRVVLSANLTVNFADAVSGDSYFTLVDYVGDGTIRTVGYSGSTVTWSGDALSHPGTLNEVVRVIYSTTDGGTNVIGAVTGGSSGASALDDLSDVVITSPAEDEQLQYVGGVWVNNARRWEAVTGGEDVFVWDGDDLVYDWST